MLLGGFGDFIFYEAVGYGQGRLLTSRWAAEMMASGIVKHWAGIPDLWYLSTLHAQQNWCDSHCPPISFSLSVAASA
jgi:hypothetical protein